MILSTHMIVAAALTRSFAATHPWIAFILAVASHYPLDALPHWAYTFASLPDEDETTKSWRFTQETFTRDLAKAVLDTALGLGIIFFIAQPPSAKEIVVLLGVALASILPDILQALYYTRLPQFEFLKSHQNFHKKFHTKIKLDSYPWLGIPLQIILILLVSALF